MSDLESCTEHVNALVAENADIIFNKKVTLAEERKWLSGELEKMEKKEGIPLVPEINGEFGGLCGVSKQKGKLSHIAKFGIAIKKKFRGTGIGTKVLLKAIEETKKQFPEVEIIELDVFATNEIAKRAYMKVGFKEVAVLPKGVKSNNKYVDRIVMYLELER